MRASSYWASRGDFTLSPVSPNISTYSPLPINLLEVRILLLSFLSLINSLFSVPCDVPIKAHLRPVAVTPSTITGDIDLYHEDKLVAYVRGSSLSLSPFLISGITLVAVESRIPAKLNLLQPSFQPVFPSPLTDAVEGDSVLSKLRSVLDQVHFHASPLPSSLTVPRCPQIELSTSCCRNLSHPRSLWRTTLPSDVPPLSILPPMIV